MAERWLAGLAMAVVVAAMADGAASQGSGSAAPRTGAATTTTALSYDDILGTWCGEPGNPNPTQYELSRQSLIVTFLPARNKKAFNVDVYEFAAGVVTLYYFPNSKERRWVKFGEFSADRRQMAQLANEAGPRYAFRRC